MRVIEIISLIIAALAFFVSIYTSIINKKAYVASSRPYVWAMNCADKGKGHNKFVLILLVRGAPAKIIKTEMVIKKDDQQILKTLKKDFIRYPHGRSEWTIEINEKRSFDNLIKHSNEYNTVLKRECNIQYSALGGKKKYFFELIQYYDHQLGMWVDISETGN